MTVQFGLLHFLAFYGELKNAVAAYILRRWRISIAFHYKRREQLFEMVAITNVRSRGPPAVTLPHAGSSFSFLSEARCPLINSDTLYHKRRSVY